MASGIYNRFKSLLMSGGYNMTGDTIKVMLLSGGHTFTPSHNFKTDISANEITGTAYAVGGSGLIGKTITHGPYAAFDATDLVYSGATFTVAHAVLYDDTDANDSLICSFDLGGNQSVTVGAFVIQWHASGIITLS